MPILPDPAYQQSAIAGPVNQALLEPATPPPQDQSALDVLAAAARGNVGGALYDRVTTPDPDMPAAPPGWDPLDHVQGFEGYASDLADAQTPAQLEGRKQRILRSQQDAEVLGKTGFWGKTGEMAFAGSDPSFLASIYVPEIRLAKWLKTAKTLTAVAHGAVAGAAYEAEMQALKEGRTAGESLYGVGSVALMSGVLGHLLSHVPPSKMKPIYDAIAEEAALARSEAGAAAVARPTTLGEESIARGGGLLSRAMANTPLIGTDLDRIMASGNVSAHTAVQELADVPQILGKNEAGIATPRSVEAAVAKYDARLADFIDHAAQQWVDYTKRVPKADRLTKREFYENIAKASRRNDSIGVPEIDSAAKFLRENIFDPLKDRAQNLGLMTDPVEAAKKRAMDRAVGDYAKAEGSQIFSDYSARTNATVQPSEFRRLLRGELEERAKPVAERAPVSAAPEPVRNFADVLQQSKEARGNLDAQLEAKLGTIEDVKQRGIENAQARADAARVRHQEAVAALEQGRPRAGEPEFLGEPAAAPAGEGGAAGQQHQVTTDVSDDGRFITVRTPNGHTEARVSGDFLQVTDTQTAEAGRRTGEHAARTRELLDIAKHRGLTLVSDTKVSDAAARSYDRLAKQGFDVIRNEASPDGEGNLISDSGKPIFEVHPGRTAYDLPREEATEFQGLRSDVPANENVGGPGEGVPGQSVRETDGRVRGEPLKVFRGGVAELGAQDFGRGALEGATTRPTLGLGAHFTSTPERAANFGRMTEHNLDIRHPATIPFEEMPRLNTPAEYRAFADDLKKQGYDGLVVDGSHVNGPTDYYAFEPEQVLEARKPAARRVEGPSKPMTPERRTIERMKLRAGRDAELRAARKMREREQRIAEEAAAAARKEHAGEARKIRETAQEARAKAVKEFQSAAAMDKKEFLKRAEKVRRTGEEDLNPEVNRMAKLMRDQEAGDLERHVQPRTVNEERVKKPLGAQSYFRRMYDRDAIRANLAEWQQTLFNHFSQDSNADPAEIRAAIDDVTKKILHADVGQANFATKVTVPAAGPLKERTLDIPDQKIEQFLINDPQRVAQSYVRDLAPQVEMAQAFGDVDMKGRLGAISDEYAVQREKLRQAIQDPTELSKRLEKLAGEEKSTLEAVVRIRDRVLGRAGRISPDASDSARRAVQVSRGWRNFVASGRLGGTAITGGVMDTAKIAAQYGFLPTISKLVKLATSPAFREISTDQARRVGSAVEAALSKRVQVAYDGAITEGWTQTLANGVYKYTGLNHITDFNRTLAATLFEDSVLKAASQISEGKPLPAFERTRLASLGLGDKELAAVADQVAKHGGEADGVRVSGSADWDNKALADIYDAAILKESKIAVQQPGAADRVWWMDKETGKLIGQLKSFSLSAPTRLLSGGLQMAGQGQYGKAARFFGYMMMGGYLTHVLRQVIAGKTPTTDPKTASFEAFSESGLGGVMPDLLSPVGRRLGILGESVRYSDRNALSAYGGPALGAANDLYDFAFNRTQGGLSAKDLHMLRRMLPWNQVWWLRREINALEGEVAEGFDLQGADHATVGERLLRTDALPNTRDGTGAGTQ